MIQHFIDKGANVDAFVRYVASNKKVKNALSFEGYDVVDDTYANKYALNVEMFRGEGSIIDLLLKNKANPNNTLFEMATAWGGVANIRVFEGYGVKFNFDVEILNTVLSYDKPDMEYIKYILSKGVKGNDESFILASKKANIELCKILLENGCNINSNINGYYAICYAINQSNMGFLKFLVDNGANLNVTCTYRDGTTTPTEGLIDYATHVKKYNYGKPEITEFLILAPVYQKKRNEDLQKISSYISEAEKYLKMNDTIQAVNSFKNAWMVSSDTSINKKVKDYFLSNSYKLYENKSYVEASKMYKMGYKVVGDCEFIESSGQSNYMAKRYIQAIQDYTESINKCPNPSFFLYYNRGYNFALLGKYKESIDDMKNLVSCVPNKAWGIFWMAWVYSKSGDKMNALTYLKQSFERGFNEWSNLDDAGFNNIKNTPEFQELIKTYKR